MSLGVPGRVVEVKARVATADFWGVMRPVRLELIDHPVTPGDYVLNHLGFAICRIPDEDVAGTLAFYETLLRSTESPARFAVGYDLAEDLHDLLEGRAARFRGH